MKLIVLLAILGIFQALQYDCHNREESNDYNTHWVCAFYKNCNQSPLNYIHSNRILATIYTDEIMSYRYCSVTRQNSKQACSDPAVESYMFGKCYQDQYSSPAHKLILKTMPGVGKEPVRHECKNRNYAEAPQNGANYKDRVCGFEAKEIYGQSIRQDYLNADMACFNPDVEYFTIGACPLVNYMLQYPYHAMTSIGEKNYLVRQDNDIRRRRK